MKVKQKHEEEKEESFSNVLKNVCEKILPSRSFKLFPFLCKIVIVFKDDVQKHSLERKYWDSQL